jgi:hypothetical protein
LFDDGQTRSDNIFTLQAVTTQAVGCQASWDLAFLLLTPTIDSVAEGDFDGGGENEKKPINQSRKTAHAIIAVARRRLELILQTISVRRYVESIGRLNKFRSARAGVLISVNACFLLIYV